MVHTYSVTASLGLGKSGVSRRVSTSNVKGCGHGQYFEGARQISSGTPFCRINAAFHLATERRIYAAAKNSVMRPYFEQVASAGLADAKWLSRCVRLLRSRFAARSIASPRRALRR